nr:MAG TPA: hypothetical protein [Caudoviricetes sp.]
MRGSFCFTAYSRSGKRTGALLLRILPPTCGSPTCTGL